MQNRGVSKLSDFARGCQFHGMAMRSGTSIASIAASRALNTNFSIFAGRPSAVANTNRAPNNLDSVFRREMKASTPASTPLPKVA
jgi:hypothetical protein